MQPLISLRKLRSVNVEPSHFASVTKLLSAWRLLFSSCRVGNYRCRSSPAALFTAEALRIKRTRQKASWDARIFYASPPTPHLHLRSNAMYVKWTEESKHVVSALSAVSGKTLDDDSVPPRKRRHAAHAPQLRRLRQALLESPITLYFQLMLLRRR